MQPSWHVKRLPCLASARAPGVSSCTLGAHARRAGVAQGCPAAAAAQLAVLPEAGTATYTARLCRASFLPSNGLRSLKSS